MEHDILLYKDIKEYENFIETIKSYNLSYIPFKVIYADGCYATVDIDDGEIRVEKFDMMPIFCSFSENHNILFIAYMKLIRFFDEDDLHNIHDFYDMDEQYINYKDIDYSFIAKCGLEMDIEEKDIIHCMFDDFKLEKRELVKKIKKSTKYYNIDEDNHIVISPEHYSQIIKRVANVKLYDYIKSRISQFNKTTKNFIDNDGITDLVGKCKLVEINGVLKME